MSDVLENSALDRWRHEPIRFIEQVLRNPKDGKPFALFEAQREFFKHAWQTGADGRLLYPEQCVGMIKKTGKTTLAGMHVLTTLLVYGGRYGEAYCVANDFDQAQGRVFTAIKQICESSPLLRREAEITASRITFPQTGAFVQAIGTDYASAAGAHPVISSFDELWGYTSERSRRLFDELIPVPTQKISCRLTTTHAGYEGESALLEEMYTRGLALPEIGASRGLHAGDHMSFFWSHEPLSPWQTPAWLGQMRRITRPIQYLRQFENRFVTSENAFIDLSWWKGRCVNPNISPIVADKTLAAWIGIDASVKHDTTAIVVVVWDQAASKPRLAAHRIFQPSAKEPLDFEQAIERTVREYCSRFAVRRVLYDPYQMAAVSQRLQAASVPMKEFPQTVGNLTEIGTTLYELIKGGNLIAYPDADIARALGHAVAKETARGFMITKEKSSHKIDVVVALAMAVHECVQRAHVKEPPLVGPIVMGRDGEAIVDWTTAPRPQPLPPRPVVPPCPPNPTPEQLREHQAALAAAHGQGVPASRGLGELPAGYAHPVFDAGPDELHWASARRWSPRPDW